MKCCTNPNQILLNVKPKKCHPQTTASQKVTMALDLSLSKAQDSRPHSGHIYLEVIKDVLHHLGISLIFIINV